MGKFDSFTLTRNGALLMSKVTAGQKLTFTRCAIGDGELPYGTDLCDLTTLVSEKMSLLINSVAFKSAGHAIVRTTYNNRNVTAEFYVRELGLFARDPDVGEILYAVANAGENADLLPAYGGSEVVEQIYDIIVLVGNVTEVTAVIDDSLIYATAQDLADHAADPMAHGNHIKDPLAHSNLLALHLWQPGKVYEVGDICYSPYAASYKRFECVAGGTSGAAEPTWPAIGQMIQDNTVKWIVDDIRDGTPVGRSVYEHRATPRPGYIKKNGALLNRSEYPRLWRYAQESGLLVTEAQWSAGMIGCFSIGNGSTTFRIPEGRGEIDRGWDDGRGVDNGRTNGSWQGTAVQQHLHYLPTSSGDAGNEPGISDSSIKRCKTNYNPWDGDNTVAVTAANGPTGTFANETRMRNVAQLVCIKY